MFCEKCGAALPYVKGVSLRTDEAILREHPVVERKTLSSSKTVVWILAILAAAGTVAFLIMQK